ncbi:hypothetical protein D3C85_1339290 [compost metagenome]
MRARREIGVARHHQLEVEQQAAVAVLGQAGQGVEPGDGEAGVLERLQQRIGQPLGELVERHQPVRRGFVAPAIAQRDAIELHAARPDRSERHQQRAQHEAGLDAAIDGMFGQVVVQIAEPGRRAEDGRGGLHHLAQPAQQAGAAFQAHQRVVRGHLEGGGDARGIHAR